MTCTEARKILYEVQTSRADESADNRKSLLLLAKAHLQVCVACNDFFEHELEMLRVLRERITHVPQPVPAGLLRKVLTNVHEARVEETGSNSGSRSKESFTSRLRRILRI